MEVKKQQARTSQAREWKTKVAEQEGKPKPSPPSLDPEQIRTKAYEVYAMRLDQGLPGDAVSDWLCAENELRAEATARGIGGRRSERST